MNILEKYGKEIDFDSLNRNLDYIKKFSAYEQDRCKNLIRTEIAEEVKKCPICNFDESNLLEIIYGFKYHKCSECGHVFIANQVKDVSLFYSSGSEGQAVTYLDDDLFEKRLQMISSPKVDFVCEFLQEREMEGGGAMGRLRMRQW